jgi:hypothetical protein
MGGAIMAEKGFERKLAAIIITDTKRDNRFMYCHGKNAYKKRS